MRPIKRTSLFCLLACMLFALIQPHTAEAQLLKKLKNKAAKKAQERLERKAEEQLDRTLEASIDTAYARVEKVFGLRSRGSGESAILNQGEAGGFATLSFAGEDYTHDDFKDVVCTFYTNGVSIDAIVNEQYGVILELINVPLNPNNHQGAYDQQAYSASVGMVSNFEYYTRPGMPARVGSILKEGKLSVSLLNKESVFFSFDGTGGNAETDESIRMQGTIKLDFSLVFQNEEMIKNYHARKSMPHDPMADNAESSGTEISSDHHISTDYSNEQSAEAMDMMQQMMANTASIDLPDAYQFDYHVKYEMKSANDRNSHYEAWIAKNEKVTMVIPDEGDEKVILDDGREAMISLNDADKEAIVISSKLSKAMAFAQSQSSGQSLENSSLQKTGNTKKILGYQCDQYVLQAPNGQGNITLWITDEIEIRHSSQMPGLTGFMSGAGFHQGIKGTLMEMYSTEASGKMSELKMVAFDKVSKTIDMSKYEVIMGFGR